MPLITLNNKGNQFRIFIWNITESVDELSRGVKLHREEREKYSALHHPAKQKEFLALRQCLKAHFGKNPPVHYTADGKPFLRNGPYISFSHTSEYAGIIISENLPVGIDLEYHRDSISRIAPKFLRTEEEKLINPENRTAHITAYWGAKEVLVKISGDRRLNFKEQIRVKPFNFTPGLKTSAKLFDDKGVITNYNIYFRILGKLYLTFGWKIS